MNLFTNTVFANIIITLATNWTGHIWDGKELGYLITNRTLIISDPVNLSVRDGVQSGEMIELKALPSSTIVWRPKQNGWIINGMPVLTNWIGTNIQWLIPNLNVSQPVSKCP